MSDPVKNLIDYRLSQARETLQEADSLFRLSLWRGTINRSYFAMFYAVLALAVLRQQVTSKHKEAVQKAQTFVTEVENYIKSTSPPSSSNP
jgi:uncharacterized protein (UPF0332 family)